MKKAILTAAVMLATAAGFTGMIVVGHAGAATVAPAWKSTPSPTSTPVPTLAPTPTLTAIPTATPTPDVTATPAPTPLPPTPSATPVPAAPVPVTGGATEPTVNVLACPLAAVNIVQLATGPIPVCYQPATPDQVLVCESYGPMTWQVVADQSWAAYPENMGCPDGTSAAMVDPADLSG